MNSWPVSGSDILPAFRRGAVVVLLIALWTAVLHLDCVVAGAESPGASAAARPTAVATAHSSAHLPAWDDCCAHDRYLVQPSVLLADPAKHWLAGLWSFVVIAAVLVPRFPAATAVRGPPGAPAFTRTGRQILTRLGIARR
ncbi:hypothetical protein AB0L57_30555 [Nocardia sp. NPDC052254]|uniref:hypothetical protein n=1 Tax=Nocardia sp. NPDC052254 TaxID=3155681 RepID=UPI00344AAFFF